MRGTGPAAAVAGVMAIAWVGWELLRFVWQRQLVVGVKGVWVQTWVGPGLSASPDGGALLLVALPALIAGGGAVLAGALGTVGRERTGRAGGAALGCGGLSLVGLATCAGLISLGTLVDGWGLPVFAVSWEEPFGWAPWARWILDAGALAAIAILLGVGPDTPLARRALWIGALAVLADSAWRAAVTLFSGQIPMLATGLGLLGSGQAVVWALLAGLAVGFVALFGNLPELAGPRRIAVLAALAGAGLWLGAQAALLWAAELFERLGSPATLFWPMPEYDGLLAALRVALFAVGCGSLGLAAWRTGPDDPP